MPIAAPATRKARIGATTAGIRTLPTSPSARTASKPTAATADPTTPPINACEELDGSPKYQVTRFQAIAPISPAKTIVGVITSALTTSLATVAATLIEMKAPMKLSSEAKPIATDGRAAPVEIEVATTLAVSWKPLVKSNASAVPTTMTMMMSELTSSAVLDDYALDDLGGRLGRVDRLLEHREHVLPADYDHRVDPVGEERGDGVTGDPVAVVLEPVDLDPVLVEVLERRQVLQPHRQLLAGGDEDFGQRRRLLHRRLDLVEAEEVGGLLGEVDDVVHLRRQRVDVLAVDRGDEGRVQPFDDLVGDPVTLLLCQEDLPREVFALGPGVHHLVEQLGGANRVLPGLDEEVEEGPVAR